MDRGIEGDSLLLISLLRWIPAHRISLRSNRTGFIKLDIRWGMMIFFTNPVACRPPVPMILVNIGHVLLSPWPSAARKSNRESSVRSGFVPCILGGYRRRDSGLTVNSSSDNVTGQLLLLSPRRSWSGPRDGQPSSSKSLLCATRLLYATLGSSLLTRP